MDKAMIEQWARDADCTHVNVLGDRAAALERLERFAALVAAHEREQCALVCDGLKKQIVHGSQMDGELAGISDCAEAIRARGEVMPRS